MSNKPVFSSAMETEGTEENISSRIHDKQFYKKSLVTFSVNAFNSHDSRYSNTFLRADLVTFGEQDEKKRKNNDEKNNLKTSVLSRWF